jgi:sulfate permease, SulP family
VPQGMAFALLAGLPPQAGIYASILPPIAYALFGTSRTLAVGPVSVAAIMVAHALSQLPAGSDPVSAALTLALLSGAFLIAMGLLRMGVIANFLSHPVLSGFTSAAAIIIVVSQLPGLTGARWPQLAEFAAAPAAGLRTIADVNPAALAIGLASIALLLFAARPLQRLLRGIGMPMVTALLLSRTAPLLVIVAGALAAGALHDAVATVGAIPRGLPSLSLALPAPGSVASLAVSALLISLVGYVESLSIAKVLANRRRQRIDPNQELIALGASNLCAGLSAGMPVAGGFSRTMVNYAAGARTQAASIITALLVALAVLAFAPLLAQVPKPALAAIIIVAVVRLIDVRGAIAIWRYDRIDGTVLAATVAGVLLLGIELGLALGIAVSLASFAARSARPHVAVLGRLKGSEHFRNVLRHDVETWPKLLLIRVDENLNFANASFLESAIATELSARHDLRHVILVMSSVNVIDSTALESLDRVAVSLREAGVTLHLSDVKGPVMDRLKQARIEHWLGDGQVFLSAHAAVEALGGR